MFALPRSVSLMDFMNREECLNCMSPSRVGSSPKGRHILIITVNLKEPCKTPSFQVFVRQNFRQSQLRFACVGGTGEAMSLCMCEHVEQGRKTVVYATLKLRNEAVKQCRVRGECSGAGLPPGI